jgi:hypothetical protein
VYRSTSVPRCRSSLCTCICPRSASPCAISTCHRQYQYIEPTWRTSCQLPRPPYILVEDFNGKHIVWGGILTDNTRTLVYDVFADFDLLLLDTGAHAPLCLGSGASSALDLTFCSPGVAVHVDWSVLPNLHGSDRYTVNLHMVTPNPATVSSSPKWITKRVYWAGFSQSLTLRTRSSRL